MKKITDMRRLLFKSTSFTKYSFVFLIITSLTPVTGVSQPFSGFINGHEYVDLGLPSGLLWATCNVGATHPSDYGDYFAWGETRPKNEYTKENCSTCTKSCKDIEGNPYYDAARANWGASWRLPSEEEFDELFRCCSWERTTYNGHDCYTITSRRNGNSIFLPASIIVSMGYYERTQPCLYWSSTPDNTTPYDSSYALVFAYSQSAFPEVSRSYRYSGHFVRPVSAKEGPLPSNGNVYTGKINGHEWVDLGLPSGLKWATCNVGSQVPGGFGCFYAWGEPDTKFSFTENNYYASGCRLNYITTQGTFIDATSHMGSTWRMPTKEEFEELIRYCSWEWTTRNGHKGFRVTSNTNGFSIFLPAGGIGSLNSVDGSGICGYYWSSSPDPNNTQKAFSLFFNISRVLEIKIRDRYLGLLIRPVSE